MKRALFVFLWLALASCGGGTDTGNPEKNAAGGDPLSAPNNCNTDVFVCPDSSVVTRDPNNSCEFFPCP